MYALTALSLLATVAASPIGERDNSPPPYVQKNLGLQGQDYEIINLARNLESLELNYWNQGLNNFTDDDFSQAGYEGFRQYVELFRDQEIAHFTALNDALGGGFENCTYTFPVSNPYEFISVAQVVTTVGEGAFIGASGLLSNPDARQTGAEIIGNEARQNSYLRQTINLDYFNAVNFDTPLTASQAYSLAKAFLSCPSSNPPISFHSIPPLTAAFTKPDGPHSAGDEISVVWDDGSVYLGDDVFITFLSDKYSIKADLKQSGGGMGTTYLPAGINGTAFLSATNYQGEAPIPDEQNFAIGYLVVA